MRLLGGPPDTMLRILHRSNYSGKNESSNKGSSFSMKWLGLCLGTLALLVLASIPIQAIPITQNLTVSGVHLQANGSTIRLKGINDQTVIPLNFYPYPAYNYSYSNHLFPQYVDDLTTKLPSTNYTDFWWQYFYLVHSLGLNAVRLGAFDSWGLSWIHSTWLSDQVIWHMVMDPMFAMAALNGVYIIFCFGGDDGTGHFSKTDGTFEASVSNPTNGSIFVPGLDLRARN